MDVLMIFKKSLSILGTKYRLIIKDLEGIWGMYDHQKGRIFIDESALEDPKDFYTTLIHELGHGVFHEGSILQAGIPREVEEILVDLMSKVIYSEVVLPILKELPPPTPKSDIVEVCEK
jgi:hypothetical protein